MWSGIWSVVPPFTHSLKDKIPKPSYETREGQANRLKVDKGGNCRLFSFNDINDVINDINDIK